MKKFLVIAAVVATSVTGFAKGKEMSEKSMSNAGHEIDSCGLGWQVTDSRTMVGTTTRATTNAFVPPSFGMTSGTIGCEQIAFAANDQKTATFVASNYQTLRSELAEGHGEYVSAMIESFGCNASQVPAISSRLQKSYDNVVTPAHNATELFNNLKNEIGTCS